MPGWGGREAGRRATRGGESSLPVRSGAPRPGAQAGPCQELGVLLAPGAHGPLPAGLRAGSRASPRPAFRRHRQCHGTGLSAVVPSQAPAPRSAAGNFLGLGRGGAGRASGPQRPVPAPGQLQGGPSLEGGWMGGMRWTEQSGVSQGGRSGRRELGQRSPVSAHR